MTCVVSFSCHIKFQHLPPCSTCSLLMCRLDHQISSFVDYLFFSYHTEELVGVNRLLGLLDIGIWVCLVWFWLVMMTRDKGVRHRLSSSQSMGSCFWQANDARGATFAGRLSLNTMPHSYTLIDSSTLLLLELCIIFCLVKSSCNSPHDHVMSNDFSGLLFLICTHCCVTYNCCCGISLQLHQAFLSAFLHCNAGCKVYQDYKSRCRWLKICDQC